jgi:hypothetical protein
MASRLQRSNSSRRGGPITTPATQGAQSSVGAVRPDDRLNTPFQSLKTSTDMFDDGLSDTLKTVGGGILKAAPILGAINQQNDKAAASAAFRNKQTELLQWGVDSTVGGIFTKDGKGLYGDGTSPTDQLKTYGEKATEFGKSGADGLKNDNQRKIFNTLWADHSASASSRASTHLTSEWTKYEKDSRALELSSTGENFALQHLTAVVDHYQSTHEKAAWEIVVKGMELTKGGHSEKDIAKTINGMNDHLASSVVRSYVKQANGSVAALTELAGGSFSDPTVKKYWDSLADNPKEQENIQRDLVRQYTEIAKVKKNERDEMDRRLFEIRDNLERDFHREGDPNKRQQIYNAYKGTSKAETSVMNQMKTEIAGGTAAKDYEPGLLQLEELIADGTIDTISDAKSYKAEGYVGRVGTPETFRTRILPLIERKNEKGFSRALQFGRASLGVVEGGITDTVTSQRVGDFTASMIEWSAKPENRGKDPMEEAREIIRKSKEQFKIDPKFKKTLDIAFKLYEKKLLEDPVSAGEYYDKVLKLMESKDITMKDYIAAGRR